VHVMGELIKMCLRYDNKLTWDFLANELVFDLIESCGNVSEEPWVEFIENAHFNVEY
jgi:hypothetical protein